MVITTHEGTEIIFDDLQHELLDIIDNYDETYLATGYDAYGNTYTAIAHFSCCEFYELTDIERDLS
jgi:hypothetical protein